jgi:mycothiol synthase
MVERPDPLPPDLPGLSWRAIGRDDLPAVVELAAACHKSDGGFGFLFVRDFILERYFPDEPGAATGAFDRNNRLAACSTVHIEKDPEGHQAKIVGLVSPDQRNQGIGTYLMQWSQAQALSLLAQTASDRGELKIATESLTEPADRLYRSHGFERVFEELVMERDLGIPLPELAMLQDVTFHTWTPDLADKFYQAYHAAFKERPGFPGWSAAEWISQVTENDLILEWTLLASFRDEPAGFVIGTIDLTTDPAGGYIWQIGVVPARRRVGIASALLVETMRRMQREGAASALLGVHTNNPGAIETYARLGFVTIGRRARYARAAWELTGV